MTRKTRPFWEIKSLEAMSQQEWESLCDGCALCCLHKLEEEDTGDIYYTRVACRQLDATSCRCRVYPQRQAHVPDCVQITPQLVRTTRWLPRSCAYRRLAEGRGLPDWHPLITGDPASTVQAGVSIRGKFISENKMGDAALEDCLLEDRTLLALIGG
ncbi:MAG: YcgN family cysteine cluster protein [Pseudomonadota bacterium]